MRKCISCLAIVLGSILLLSSAASADHEDGRDHENVCGELDSGKIDTNGDPASVTVTAPEGQLISAYCVKAGSANQDDGPEYVTVTPPVKELTISHSSGKDVSHYSLSYVNDGSTTTTEPTTTTTTEPVTTTTEPPVTTTEPPVTTTEPPVTVPPTTEPPSTVPPVTEPPIGPKAPETPPKVVAPVAPAAPAAPATIVERTELPHTGGGTLVLALGGIGLILLGVILTRRGASIS